MRERIAVKQRKRDLNFGMTSEDAVEQEEIQTNNIPQNDDESHYKRDFSGATVKEISEKKSPIFAKPLKRDQQICFKCDRNTHTKLEKFAFENKLTFTEILCGMLDCHLDDMIEVNSSLKSVKND